MPGALTTSHAEELAEDLETSWVPDVAANLEIDDYEADSELACRPAQPVLFPRPHGSDQTVFKLHPSWHVAMHEATATLRQVADDVLAPGVSGYRSGAQAGSGYSSDYQGLRELFDYHASRSAHVVFCDVRRFFWTLSPTEIGRALAAVPLPDGGEALLAFVRAISGAGLPSLPPGYADARLVANIVLVPADSALEVPFTRWVDDYRLFVPPGMRPEAAVDTLRRGLAAVGLQLNDAKTRILPVDHAAEVVRNSLGSVYHPDRDPPERVRENLRRLLEETTADPVRHRRALRFVLPRLALEQDDVAVPFALRAIEFLPWDAPRLVSYLGHFIGEKAVDGQIDLLLRAAAARGDTWLTARLAPLGFCIQLSDETVRELEDVLPSLAPTPAWGLAVRLLARTGRLAPIQRDDVPDVRAAMTAASDVGLDIRERWAEKEPVLARALVRRPAPCPRLNSLL